MRHLLETLRQSGINDTFTWGMFYISCDIALFFVIASVLELGVQFYFVLIFISVFHNFFWKVQLSHVLRRVQNKNYTSELQQLHPDIYCKKWLLKILCFSAVYFSWEAVLQDMPKDNPTKKQSNGEIQVILKHALARKCIWEKVL